MQAIMYVAHGSRKAEKNKMMQQFVAQIKKERPESLQELAFLEADTQTLKQVAHQLAEKGATQILVVPLLLFSAMHHQEDIPTQLQAIQKELPQLIFIVADTFGMENEVAEVAYTRITDTLNSIATHPIILMVAHGSKRFNEPKEAFEKVVQTIQEKTTHTILQGLLYGEPQYETICRQALEQGNAILIMPYFLFDGHLIDKIKTTLGQLPHSEEKIYYTQTLQLDTQMIPSILRKMKVAEANV